MRCGQQWASCALFLSSHAVFSFSDMRGWLKGCACHEEERKQGKVVQCQWAGCRAPELASRVQTFLAELQGLGQLDAFLELPEWARELCDMWRRAYTTLEAKFAWVFENPYRIWQVSLWSGLEGVWC